MERPRGCGGALYLLVRPGFIGQPIMGLLTSHQVDAYGVDLARGFRGINRRLRRLFIPRSARCAPKGG